MEQQDRFDNALSDANLQQIEFAIDPEQFDDIDMSDVPDEVRDIIRAECDRQTLSGKQLITPADYNNAMHMARAMAVQLRNKGWTKFTVKELQDAGFEGIAEAAVRFEPTKGTVRLTKFTSYAYFWIRKMQQEYIAKNKSILSGSMTECYLGMVPYTDSIDAMDDNSESDHAGSDHCAGLVSDTDIYQDMIDSETLRQRRDLLASMFARLPELERTAYMLSNGIGTVNGTNMTVREIAAAMDISIGRVSFLVNNAKALIQAMRNDFEATYNDINN